MTSQSETDAIVAEVLRRRKDHRLAIAQPLDEQAVREIEGEDVPEEYLRRAHRMIKRLSREKRHIPGRGTIPMDPEEVGLEPDEDIKVPAIPKPTVGETILAKTMMEHDQPRQLKKASYDEAIEYIKFGAPIDPKTSAQSVPFFEAEMVNRAVRTALFHVRLADTGRKWDKTNCLRALQEAHFVAMSPDIKLSEMERIYAIGSLKYLRWIVEKLNAKTDFGLIKDAFDAFLKNWDLISIQVYEREK